MVKISNVFDTFAFQIYASILMNTHIKLIMQEKSFVYYVGIIYSTIFLFTLILNVQF